MQRRAWLTLVLAAALGAGVVNAVPGAARLVKAEPLGGVTTLDVTHSGTAELVLYDDATVSARETHNPDVSISGPGRLIGFELSRADGSGSAGSDDALDAVRLPAFAGGSTYVTGSMWPHYTCTSWPNGTVPLTSNCTKPGKVIKLHEGYYHLVALADGGALRVTIHLHGVQLPTSTVHLQSTFRSAEAALPERESIGSSTVTYGTALAFKNPSQVTMVVTAKLHQDATVRGASACTRSDQGAPPPGAYSPACPNGDSGSFAYRLNVPAEPEGGGVFVAQSAVPGNSNNVGQGGSFTDSDGPVFEHGLGVWVSGATLPFWDAFVAP